MNDKRQEQPSDAANNSKLVRLLQDILVLHETELDCESCNEQIDCLAELVAAGHDPKKLLPAVQAHLECCTDCREEFEALLCILKGQQKGQC